MHNSGELLPLVYERLKQFAKARFSKRDSLHGTELVHEAYLRVADETQQWESVAHFFGSVRNAMRNAIVDHIRRKNAAKRSSEHKQVDRNMLDLEADSQLPQIVALSDALDALALQDERAANVVTLRFFACMTEREIAEELNIAERTVARDWVYARAWLRNVLAE